MVIRVFPAIGATPRTKAEKLFCRALLVHVVWWVNERRVPLRFQIGLAQVAQDHLGMEFILTMARHVIVVPFRDNDCETRLYTPLHCVPITPTTNRPQLSPLKSLIGHLSNMATAVLPYSTQHYNSLPSIADAGRSLKPADIALLTTTIGQVFVKHKVQKLFGIILLHNHFSLDENEILVNIGSVAVPWKTPSLAEQLRDVKGSAWRFTEQGIAPYEFAYDVSSLPDVSGFQPFISELRALLDRLGLTEKLGICVFTSEDLDSTTRVEFTQGRANITLPFDIAPEDGPNRSIEAVWQFDLSPELGTETRK